MRVEIIEEGSTPKRGLAPLKKARAAVRKLKKAAEKLKDSIKYKAGASVVVMVVAEVNEEAGRAREATNSLPTSMKKSFLSTINKITAKATRMFKRFRNKAEVIATIDESGKLIEASLPMEVVEARKEASSVLKTLRNAVKSLGNLIKDKAPKSEIEAANTKINEVVEHAKTSAKSLPTMIKEKLLKWVGKLVEKATRSVVAYKNAIEIPKQMPKETQRAKYQSDTKISGAQIEDRRGSLKFRVQEALGIGAVKYKVDGDANSLMLVSRQYEGGRLMITPEGINIHGGILSADKELLQDVLKISAALYKTPLAIYAMDSQEREIIKDTAKNMNPPIEVKTFDSESGFRNGKNKMQEAAASEVNRPKVVEEVKQREPVVSPSPRVLQRPAPEPIRPVFHR